MIVGHRGAAALAPENTMAGIKKAAKLGCQWIETDTHLSGDNVPVIFHDQTVDRCTNGTGKVSELSAKQLRELDAGSWFADDFVGERIPTLEELLSYCKDQNMGINLELKVYDLKSVEQLVEQVGVVIEKVSFDTRNLLLSSFSIEAVKECKRVFPDIRVGLITEDATLAYLDEIKPLNLYSVHVDQKILSNEMAKTLTALGYELNIWTLNDATKAAHFKSIGVEHIITDDPSLF
ncbi:glycerophosphodiester phosphodiesterase family protein [Vibrio sp. HN007]|uniref:glycerophosphodiester phosphodiesterase family protein n=1 Tax=Vibrio iocasae TaxID=3098914 RepID=UPI0035D3E3BC